MASQAANTPEVTEECSAAVIRSEQPLWDQQCILSLDGGGIRGYSSLIIMRRLMIEVQNIERDFLEHSQKAQHSSYFPESYVPCVDNRTLSSLAEGEPSKRTQKPETESADGQETSCENSCRYLPCHYFDYIGGTSTGGLTSIMLGRLRMSVGECVVEYKKLASAIFNHPRWMSVRGPIPWLRDKYDGKNIQRAVQDVVNRRMPIEEMEIGAGNFNSRPGLCRTVVFAYASKILEDVTEYRPSRGKRTVGAGDSKPYLIRSYNHWGPLPQAVNQRNPGLAHSIAIWEAARATTAAPTYFDTIKISNRIFGDGGFGTNNPAEEMFWEVTQMNGGDCKNHSIALLLSIGTGISQVSRFSEGAFAKYWTYFNAASKLAADSNRVHETMETLKKLCNIPYFRFNVPEEYGLGKVKLDELKKPNRFRGQTENTLDMIERITETYCDLPEVRSQLKLVAEILVSHRRERSKTDMWSFVANGRHWRCGMDGCRRCQELKARKHDLKHHLKEQHQLIDGALENMLKQSIYPPPREGT